MPSKAKSSRSKTKAPKRRINSRRKGCHGELEFAHFLSGKGLSARRGQQFSGGTDSPDVVCEGLPGVHWEVKRVEAGNLYSWLGQAQRDAGAGRTPVVAHRKNGKDWVAIVPMDIMVELLIQKQWGVT